VPYKTDKKVEGTRKALGKCCLRFEKNFSMVSGLVILAVVFARFGVEVGVIAGLLALAGGTILGFAAMKTLGSAIES
jgi:hypothetical protein